jgi:coenzyme F420-0:L-glutamate ligase/coenzyme F420-1:gamma-L-glutamate ligase
VAIGWAGLPASRDWRGERDLSGRELGVTVECVVDELAAAANLLMGEGSSGTPAVVARDWEFGSVEGSEELFRAVETDYVRQALRGWSYVRD